MSNILRTSIISVGTFCLGVILVVLYVEKGNPDTLAHTNVSSNNTAPPLSLVNATQLDQQNKIDELIISLNMVRKEVAYIGQQQKTILEQQNEMVATEIQTRLNESMESFTANDILNNPEPEISDAEFQMVLEQQYTMYDSLYQAGEDDPRIAIRVQDAFQVMQTNDDIDVGTVNCSENICRMQTTVTSGDVAHEFVNRFPAILPWGTEAAYFITIQTDGSAQVTHFFATEGVPLPEYLGESSG